MILNSDPNQECEVKFKLPQQTSRELIAASLKSADKAAHNEIKIAAGVWDRPADASDGSPTCGHVQSLDRQCKSCRKRYCPECHPNCHPEPDPSECSRCRGPVWSDSVAQPPEVRNPAMTKGY